MSGYPVEIEELKVMGDHFTTANYPYFEELREAFRLLRLTGCRISEIFEISRWSIISGYTVQLQPQKGNNPRTIILDPTFNNFLNAISGQYKPFLGRSSFQLQYIFSKINIYGPIFSGTKEITNYFFRYLFVRELNADGLTFEQIADVMGYTSTTAVNNYLNASLISTIEVPVIPSDPLPEGHIDIFTVPTLFNGNSDNFIIPNPISSNKISIYFECVFTATTDMYILDIDYFYQNYIFPTIRVSKYSGYNRIKFYLYKRATAINPAFTSNINTLNIFKYFISMDFSIPYANDPMYVNPILRRTADGITFFEHTAVNQFLQYPKAPNLIVGCHKSSLGVISYPYIGTFLRVHVWDRILSDAEILTMFNL